MLQEAPVRRVLRISFKLGLIAAIGVGIAVVVKKLTAPPADSTPLEPWPPLSTETTTGTGADEAAGDGNGSGPAGEAEAAAEEPAPSAN
jgi:hypothetical protein